MDGIQASKRFQIEHDKTPLDNIHYPLEGSIAQIIKANEHGSLSLRPITYVCVWGGGSFHNIKIKQFA